MTLAELLLIATTIKNETVEENNSASRIGTALQAIINYCNERIPEFAKYKENVEKLMVLI